jgi:ribonuclease Y
MIVAASAVGVFVGMLLRRKLAESRIASAEKASEQIVEEARKEADSIRKEAVSRPGYGAGGQDRLGEGVPELRRELQAQEKRLLQKEETWTGRLSSWTTGRAIWASVKGLAAAGGASQSREQKSIA